MSILFVDSFDHYQTADITRKWTSRAGATIGSFGRRSSQGLMCNAASQFTGKVISANTTMIVGAAVNRPNNTARANLFQFKEGSTIHVTVTAEPGGFIAAYLGAPTTTQLGISTVNRIVQDQYVFIEAKVFVHDTTGTVEVRVNGEVVLNLPPQDTANGGTPTIDGIRISGAASYDDFYICDDQGSDNNDFLGDVEIEHILPDGAGNATQWTTLVGAATHWQAVDESPAIDDDTSYVETATNTHLDQFTFANLSSISGGSTVLAVQVNTMARVDSGSASIATEHRESGTDSTGATVVLGTGWLDVLQVWENNPNGGGAWTDTIINASEFGFSKVA